MLKLENLSLIAFQPIKNERSLSSFLQYSFQYCHTRLHLGFSAKLRIWQASACKMEPRSGIISCKKPSTHPPRHLSLEGLDLSINLSDHMSVPTYYVCPHLLCLSPPIMSVPTFHVCPHLLCLSPPIVSVPILTSLKNILIWPTQLV